MTRTLSRQRRQLDTFSDLYARLGSKRTRRLAYLTTSALVLGGAQGAAMAQTVTQVTTDGRTDTTVTNPAGSNTTTVTTNTRSGGNALNSFSVFDVGAPDTVNLIVPEDVNALVNIVRDKAVTIDGTVNSLVGGDIGGNVFFVDSHGFVVGETGTINVGSLTVVTPTSGFVDGIIDATGGISTAALGSLMAGDVPLSSSGNVVIRGAVNAANGVSLTARDVTVGVGGSVNAGLKGSNPLFQSSVNINNLRPGARMVELQGRIEIVAEDVTLGGTLDATGTATPGAISVVAEQQKSSASDTLLTNTSASASIRQGAQSVIRGGEISLSATAGRTVVQGLADADASVSIAGRIEGTDVSITADAAATATKAASLTSIFTAGLDTAEGIFGDMQLFDVFVPLFDTAAALPLPTENIGYASVESNALVHVGATANIRTTQGGDVLLRSNALQSFKQAPISGSLIGLTFASVDGSAATNIARGATVASAGDLAIASHNTAIANLQVATSTDATPFGVTLAALDADIAANTTVDRLANINVRGDLSVIGRNDTSYSVNSKVEAKGTGRVGIAAAVAVTNAEATALLDADVGQGNLQPANVLVEASSVGALSDVSASTTVGGSAGPEIAGVRDLTSAVNSIQNTLVNQAAGKLFETASAAGVLPKIGSVIAYRDSSATSVARISGDVTASGTIAVVANRIDGGARTSATSAVASDTKDKEDNTPLAVNAAIAVNLGENETLALVAPNANLAAGKVGVQANYSQPRPYQWDNLAGAWETVGNMGEDFAGSLAGLFGSLSGLRNTGAYATGNAEAKGSASKDVNINGVVNYFELDNVTSAWVGSGASIIATDPTDDAGWSVEAAGGDASLFMDPTELSAGTPGLSLGDGGVIPTFDFDTALSIGANSVIETLFLSGSKAGLRSEPSDPGAGGGTGGGTGGTGDDAGVAVGGVFTMTDIENSTLSGVAAGANLQSAGEIAVGADADTTSYVIAPGSGKGGDAGATGVVAVSLLDEATHASIANTAFVSAPSVNVDANQGVNIWSLTGALAGADKVGVGVSVAVNDLNTDTSAIIGDNSGDAALAAGIDASAGDSAASTAQGVFNADTLSVTAATRGQAGALSIGLASAGTSEPPSGDSQGGGLSGLVGGAKGKLKQISGTIDSVKGALDPLLNPVGNLLNSGANTAADSGKTQMASTDATTPPPADAVGGADAIDFSKISEPAKQGFAIGVAGSGSVGLYDATTTADVANITRGTFSTDGSSAADTNVQAVRNASYFTLSGAVARIKGGPDSKGVGIAGALALTEDSGDTLARMVNVDAPNAGDTSVEALSGGFTVGVGIGAAVTSGQQSSAIAASGTLSFLHGATNAIVANSALTGAPGANLAVRGYNNTQIGLGGGSFYKGGSAGVGATVTLSLVGDSQTINPLTGQAYDFVGAHVSDTQADFERLVVEAQAPIRLITAAATGGVSGNDGTAISIGAAYSEISRTVAASVTGSVITARANDGGLDACEDETCGLLVSAGTEGSLALDQAIGAATARDAGFDFTGDVLNGAFSNQPNGAAIYTVAGLFQSGKNAAGLGFAGGNITDTYAATIAASRVDAAESGVAVVTKDTATVAALSAGASISRGNGGLAFMGSATANLVRNTDRASITGGTAFDGTTAGIVARDVTVLADADASIASLAGNIAAGQGTSAGVSVAFNQIDRAIDASISGIDITPTGDVSVSASADGQIRTLSVSGAGGSDTALTGSFTINNIADDVAASIAGGANIAGAGADYVTVQSVNASDVEAIAGSLAVSANGSGAGIAVAVNVMEGTNAARISGANITANDVDVLGVSTGDIGVASVGGAVGAGSAGIGGSITTNILNSATSARINGGSVITAANNASVQATNLGRIFAASGAIGIGNSAGVGVGVTTNVLNAQTIATVDNSTITARGEGAGRVVSDGIAGGGLDTSSLVCLTDECVDQGTNNTRFENTFLVGGAGSGLLPDQQVPTFGTKTVKGLSVGASSAQNVAVLSAAAGVSGGSAGVGVDVGVSVLSGNTSSRIYRSDVVGNADVVAGAYGTVGQAVAGIGGASSVGIGAAASATKFTQNVSAKIDGGTVTGDASKGEGTSVQAYNNQQAFALTAGFAGSGSASVAGSVNVNLFDSDTSATIDNGALVNTGAVTVDAETFNAVGGVTGAIGIGGSVGASGAFNVTTMKDRTVARIGNLSDPQRTSITAGGDVSVAASGIGKYSGLAVSGAGGGNVGVGGIVNVIQIESDVQSGLYNTNVRAGANGVDVTADLDTQLNQISGGIGIGGFAGLGVAVNVGIIRDKASAEVIGGDIVSGGLTVDASKTRRADSLTLSAGGGIGGVAGVVNVLIVGSAPNVDDDGDDDGLSSGDTQEVLGRVDSVSNTDFLSGNPSLSAGQRTAASTAGTGRVTNALDSTANANTVARISQSTVVSDTVSVSGTDKTASDAQLGAIAGGAGALAGLVGYTRINGSVEALASGDITASEISVNAASDDIEGTNIFGEELVAGRVRGVAGAVGGVGAAGVVANVSIGTSVGASAEGNLAGDNGGTLGVSASDSSSGIADGNGAAAGGVGVGVSVAIAERTGSISATLAQNTLATNFTGIAVDAASAGSISASTIALSGGILGSGSGSLATANDETVVLAAVEDGVETVFGAGGLTIDARSASDTAATALGASVAGSVAIGASIALATNNAQVSATDDALMHVGTGTLAVRAALNGVGTSAEAGAAVGGVLGGAQASVATARNNGTILARMSSDALVGAVDVAAINDSRVSSDAEGISAGIVAVGAVVSVAESNSNTRALIGDFSPGSTGLLVQAGSVSVRADSTDTTTPYALAGSGGLVSGSAARADNINTSVTSAEILSGDVISAGNLTLSAQHTAGIGSVADARQASAVGFSGAEVNNTIAATTAATVGNSVRLAALNIDIDSSNNFVSTRLPNGAAISAYGGGGGAINGSAVTIDTDVTGSSNVIISDNATLLVDGNPVDILKNGLTDVRALNIDASSTLALTDFGQLELGAGIAIPIVSLTADASLGNLVLIGENTTLQSSGAIGIGSWTRGNLVNDAKVKVYGLAGAGGAETEATLNTSQFVTIGANADLLAYGNLRLGAGRASSGAETNTIDATAGTRVYNNTAIPITALLDADGRANSANALVINDGARIRTVLDADLVADQGTVNASGVAIGTNPYLDLFSSETRAGSASSTGTGTIQLGGSVEAGVAHNQSVIVDEDGGVTTSSTLGDTGGLPNFSVAAQYQRFGQDPRSAAVVVSPIYAAAGDINVIADSIAEIGGTTASLTANGDVDVLIDNASQAALIPGEIYIPNAGSGLVNFAGNASPTGSGISITQSPTTDVPAITIRNSYDAFALGGNGLGSPISISQPIFNPGGSVTIENVSGDIAQTGQITASQVRILAPNGSFVVSQSGIYSPVDPTGQWDATAIRLADEWDVVTYMANFLLSPGSLTSPTFIPGEYDSVLRSIIRQTVGTVTGITSSNQQFGFAQVFGRLPFQENDQKTERVPFAPWLITSSIPGFTQAFLVPEVNAGLRFTLQPGRRGYVADSTFNWWGPYSYAGKDDFNDGFIHKYSTIVPVAQAIEASAARQNTSGAAASGISAKSIEISADAININATLSAGALTQRSVTIDPSAQAHIDRYVAAGSPTTSGNGFTVVNGYLSLDGFTSSQGTPLGAPVSGDDTVGPPGQAVSNPNFGKIATGYDGRRTITAADGSQIANPDFGKIVVADVTAAGGGSITLDGGIISTDGQGNGNLIVRNGFGEVDINNQTQTAIVLGDISTGTGDQTGIIKITDHYKENGLGSNLTTWYVSEQGGGPVTTYDNRNGATEFATARVVSQTADGGSVAYDPFANIRYGWNDQYTVRRNVNFTDNINTATVTPWLFTGGTNNENFARGPSYVFFGNPSDPFFRSEIIASQQSSVNYGIRWRNFAFINRPDYNNPESVVWNYRIYTRAGVTIRNSVRADNAIGIGFEGASSGRVSVISDADVALAGDVSNTSGYTFIGTDGAIVDAGGSIQSGPRTLLSALGDIGSADAPINLISGVPGGGRTNLLGANIYVSNEGDLALGVVDANFGAGTVDLTATGDILSVDNLPTSTPAIVASELSLTSTGGAIGNADKPLTFVADRVSAQADGDITLTQSFGNIVVDRIRSTNGGITLEARDGTITGALPTEAERAAFETENQQAWQQLGLLDQDSGALAVSRYEGSINSAYALFWQIDGLIDPGNSNRLSDEGRTLFGAQAASALGVANPTNAQIDSYVLGLYSEAGTTVSDAPGVDPAALATRDDAFDFMLDEADPLFTELTSGAQWEEGALSTVIGTTRLIDTRSNDTQTAATGTNLQAQTGISLTSNGSPDIPRVTVQVTSNGDSSSYFVVTGPGTGYTPTANTNAPGQFTLSEIKELLATARNPVPTQISDSTYEFELGGFKPVTANTEDGMIEVTSNNDFTLDIEGDILLSTITADVGGTLFLRTTNGNVLNGTPSTLTLAGKLSLEAAGFAGTVADPLRFSAFDPSQPFSILDITTGQGFNIDVIGSAATIGNLSFSGLGSISADGGITRSSDVPGSALIDGNGGMLVLDAGSSAIGLALQPLDLDVASDTRLSLNAAAAYLSTQAGGQSGGDLTLADVTIDGAFSINAGGAIAQSAGVSAPIRAGTVSLLAGSTIGGAAPLNLDTAGGEVRSIGTGDVNLLITNSANADPINLVAGAAGGSLTIAADGSLILGDTGAQGSIDLQTASGNLTVGDVTSDDGDISFASAGDFAGGNLAAVNGAISGNANGALEFGGSASDGATSLTANGPIAFTGVMTSNTDIALSTPGDISGGSIEAGGSVAVQGGGVNLTGVLGDNLALQAANGMSIAELESVGDANLQAASANIGNVAVGGQLVVTTTGELAIASGLAFGAALDSGGDITIGSLDGDGGDLTVTAAGALTAESLIEFEQIDLSAAQIDVQSLVGNAINTASTGATSFGLFFANNAATIDARSLQTTTLFAQSLNARTDDELFVDELQVADTSNIDAGSMTIRLAAAGTFLSRTIGDTIIEELRTSDLADLQAANLQIALLESGGSIDLDVGSAQIDSIVAGADLDILAQTDIVFGTAESGGSTTMDAGQLIEGDTLTAGGDVNLSAETIRIGNISGENIGIAVTGDLAFDSIGSRNDLDLQGRNIAIGTASVGGDFAARAVQTIDVDTAEVGGDLRFIAGEDVISSQLLQVAGTAIIRAGDDIVVEAIDSGGTQALVAGGDITATTLTSGGDVALRAGGDISTTSIAAINDIRLTGRRINFGTITGENFYAVNRLSLIGDQLFVTGDVSIRPPRGAPFSTVKIGELSAENATIKASGTAKWGSAIQLGSARIGNSLSLYGESATASVFGTGPTLSISLDGFRAPVMTYADIDVTSLGPVDFEQFEVKRAFIDLAGRDVTIFDGWTERLELSTADLTLLINNLSGKRERAFDHQRYFSKYRFDLTIEGLEPAGDSGKPRYKLHAVPAQAQGVEKDKKAGEDLDEEQLVADGKGDTR